MLQIPGIHLTSVRVQQIDLPILHTKQVTVDVLRLDEIDPEISGNKFFKLRCYLEHALAKGYKKILTRGGAWSNHILATAAACERLGLQSTGIIRGEQPQQFSRTLERAAQHGMQFIFQDRKEYRENIKPQAINSDYYEIPEGGYGNEGAKGAATIADLVSFENYTHIIAAAGTGTTIAGISNRLKEDQVCMAVSVLKGFTDLEENIMNLMTKKDQLLLTDHAHHFGGYAKYTGELITFMNNFFKQTGIPTDFVYTGKMFAALQTQLQQNVYPPGSRILSIHTGGLQGNASLSKGTLIF